MKKMIRNTLALLLAILMLVELFGIQPINAKEISLPVPTIKVKSVSNGTGIKVTIGKTKDAEGYEIYAVGKPDSYADYINFDEDFQKITEVKKNGKAKRTVTIRSLPSGSYKIKVKSYNSKKYGTMTYSDFSKEKSIKVKEAPSGYKSSYDFSKVKKGDIIKFGAYEQDGDFTNGKEAIEWVVLEKTKKQVFVVSKYVLDCLPYNKEATTVTWEDCSLRNWLNEKFYANAFNTTEQNMIKTTTVENFDNAIFGTPGGNDTKDKVFLLSQLEIINSDYGFDENYATKDIKRRCAPTDYAVSNGCLGFDEYKTEDGLDSAWSYYLRSPGKAEYIDYGSRIPFSVSRVHYTGACDTVSIQLYPGVGVRPALVINLKS